MYQYVTEKRLFDRWGKWCEGGWDTHKYLGVNVFGFPKRSALDRIGEGGESAGPPKYGQEKIEHDTADMELISYLMRHWQYQMPKVHGALMVRHRDIYPLRRPNLGMVPAALRGKDSRKAWCVVGDGSMRGVRKFYELCDAGYRILHVNLRPDFRMVA